ncbi:MAG: alpha/beta fold hydrolase [Pseudomonadota bacterium]
MTFDIAIPEWGPREIPAPARFAAEIEVRLPATDGYPLAGTLYRPRQSNGVAVVISSAYAAPRGYYRAYARFLAARGFAVLTYDYRGIGDSRGAGWAGLEPRLRHWGERDLAAAIDWLADKYPHSRMTLIGHSIGGQLLGLAPNHARVVALLAVASQSGYWRLRDGSHRIASFLYFHVFIPLMALLSRGLPSLRRGEFDVPSGVALEFARWGRHPQYIVDEVGRPLREHFDAWGGQARFYHFTDDHDFAPRRAVAAIAGFYRNAKIEIVHRAPEDWGLSRIGHFGFFRSSMPAVAWQETAHWLERAAMPQYRSVQALSEPTQARAA